MIVFVVIYLSFWNRSKRFNLHNYCSSLIVIFTSIVFYFIYYQYCNTDIHKKQKVLQSLLTPHVM